jgi:glutaredoxin-related protein
MALRPKIQKYLTWKCFPNLSFVKAAQIKGSSIARRTLFYCMTKNDSAY